MTNLEEEIERYKRRVQWACADVKGRGGFGLGVDDEMQEGAVPSCKYCGWW